MITSERQLAASEEKLEMLRASLNQPTVKGVPEKVLEGGKSQIRELIAELQAEIEEYTALKENRGNWNVIHSFSDLRVMPIKYRIAHHLTVETFSRLVGVGVRQIHRYEVEQYSKTNVRTLEQIIEKLDVEIEGSITAH